VASFRVGWGESINLSALRGSMIRMKCYSLLLGARNTPAATARFSAKDEKLLRNVTFRHFPNGFTILNADGGWFDPVKKTFIKEQSRQILVCTSEPKKLAAWCDELRTALKQDELLVMELGRASTYSAKGRSRRKLIFSRRKAASATAAASRH
jgi:hypothetical protein